MAVLRIVPNLAASNPAKARAFYGALLGLDVAMDMGWIMTFESDTAATPQISVATEGGSGTMLPDLSIEVDNVDEIYTRAKAAGFEITYGIADEPWGVRRFYVRDPLGKIQYSGARVIDPNKAAGARLKRNRRQPRSFLGGSYAHHTHNNG